MDFIAVHVLHINVNAHIHTQLYIETVNFHCSQTIFSCLAKRRTNCWPQPETLTGQPMMWQNQTNTHTTTIVLGQIIIFSQQEVWRLYHCQRPLSVALWVYWGTQISSNLFDSPTASTVVWDWNTLEPTVPKAILLKILYVSLHNILYNLQSELQYSFYP